MRVLRILPAILPVACLVVAAPGNPAAGNAQKGWFEKAVKKVDAKFEPAEAKPGQVVTFKLTVELNEGYHTYPTMQPDKAAVGYTNLLKFPTTGAAIFVGAVEDPKNYEEVAEPEQGIRAMRKYSGSATFTRKVVVSPRAPVGPNLAKVTLKLMVCDKSVCYAPKDVTIETSIKVLDGPPVPVPPEFAAEVARALGGN